MANYATLKAAIQQVVKTNGNNEITGALLQQSLLAMINSLGGYYQFVGIATTGTDPGTPDQNVFYIAGPGTYANFDGAVVGDGKLAVFKYNGTWVMQTVDVGKTYDTAIQLLERAALPCAIMSTTWQRKNYTHYVIPVNGGERVDFSITSGVLYCAFLRSYTQAIDGATPDFCTGFSGRQTKTASFTLPSDCRYIIVNNPGVALTMFRINGYDYLPGIYNTLGLITSKLSDFTLTTISNNIANPSNIVDGYYVGSTGLIVAGSAWALIRVPVEGGKTYAFGGFYLGRFGYGAFYDENDNFISVFSYDDPSGTTNPKTATAPENAKYMYLDIKSGLSPSNPYENLQINVGSYLLQFDAYQGAIETLFGHYLYAKDYELREIVNAAVFRNPKMVGYLPNRGYINYNTGVLTVGGYKTTDFLPVTPGMTVKVNRIQGSASVAILAAYGSVNENSYIQSSSIVGTNTPVNLTYIVPDGCNFIRLCSVNTIIPTYGFIPYVPFLTDDNIATSITDANEKLATVGIAKQLSGIVKPTIRLYPQTKLPCVSFQFDDIPAKDSELVSLFESYGLTCAFAFIASESNINSKSNIYIGYQKRGFQIMNHSIDGTVFDTTNYTYQTAMAAIMTALNRIQKAGMVCNGFVSPSSSMATEFLPILKAAHAYAFTSATTSQTANGRTQDTCQLHRYSLQSNTLAQIEQYIDDCITNDQIMTFYGHAADLVDGGDTSVFSLAKIAAVIEYCIGKRDTGLLYIGGTDDCVKCFFDL